MKSNYPDPSLINQTDFYSSAFRIKRLLRRRGWHNVEPMGGDIYGLMPRDYYEKWLKYPDRIRLVKEKNGGKEFEHFVAQIIAQYYCNPATFSNKITDLGLGGDYDVLVEGPGESLFYFETKASASEEKETSGVDEIWNFMVRETALGADMSVFLYDGNYKFNEILVPLFEILYSLAKHLYESEKGKGEPDIDNWLERVKNGNITQIARKIGRIQLYFLYWPVILIAGGDKIRNNIGEALSIYYGGIKYISPFGRLENRPTREPFANLPNWRKLLKMTKGKLNEADLLKYAKKIGKSRKYHKY